MEFRTIVKQQRCESTIDHQSRLLLLGSCFSDNIASRLHRQLFNVTSNPFGTLYNPASIHKAIEHVASERPFTADDIFYHNGLYHSPLCHSSLSRANEHEMIENLNRVSSGFRSALLHSNIVFLTFGTAWVFEDAKCGGIVANCHKLPADRFNHRFMDVDECLNHILQSVGIIRKMSPEAKIILTLSPIRHLANGAHGNQLSKATLLIAIEKAISTQKDVSYFPSYEICLDDLRDYRFYAADMCHPSETACDYIFEQFANTYFNDATKSLADRCLKLSKRLTHRVMTADRKTIEQFRNSTDSLVSSLLSEYPFLRDAVENINKQI